MTRDQTNAENDDEEQPQAGNWVSCIAILLVCAGISTAPAAMKA